MSSARMPSKEEVQAQKPIEYKNILSSIGLSRRGTQEQQWHRLMRAIDIDRVSPGVFNIPYADIMETLQKMKQFTPMTPNHYTIITHIHSIMAWLGYREEEGVQRTIQLLADLHPISWKLDKEDREAYEVVLALLFNQSFSDLRWEMNEEYIHTNFSRV
jgi:hypothetical protein